MANSRKSAYEKKEENMLNSLLIKNGVELHGSLVLIH